MICIGFEYPLFTSLFTTKSSEHLVNLGSFLNKNSFFVDEGVGIMAKVLSLMATHTDDGSLYNRSVAKIDEQLSNI